MFLQQLVRLHLDSKWLSVKHYDAFRIVWLRRYGQLKLPGRIAHVASDSYSVACLVTGFQRNVR